MAMRRPRIKASANLMASKRKTRITPSKEGEKNEVSAADQTPSITEEAPPMDPPNDSLKTQDAGSPVIVEYPTPQVPEVTDVVAPLAAEPVHDSLTEVTAAEIPVHIPVPAADVLITESPVLVTTPAPTIDAIAPSLREVEIEALQLPLRAKVRESVVVVPAASTTEGVHHQEAHPLNSFKCPPQVEANPSSGQVLNGVSSPDVIGADLKKPLSEPTTAPIPSLAAIPTSATTAKQSRQRIKPVPIFGQRRNSFVGSAPSPSTGDDSNAGFDFAIPHRRERHTSASHHGHQLHKFTPYLGGGRIRTESGCSAVSDSATSSFRVRKTDDNRAVLRRELQSRFVNGIPDKASLKMLDLIYYNPISNPMEARPNFGEKDVEPSSSKVKEAPKEPTTSQESEDTKADTKPTDNSEILVPQLKLNATGDLIIDDLSLEIETTGAQKARTMWEQSVPVYMDEITGANGFYKRQKRTKDWTSEETVRFYRCLQTVGTDFSLMCQLLPQRSRRDLKLKFKKEERNNGALINKAILYPKMFNVEELKVQFAAEEKKRLEYEAEVQAAKQREKPKKVVVRSSKAARSIAGEKKPKAPPKGRFLLPPVKPTPPRDEHKPTRPPAKRRNTEKLHIIECKKIPATVTSDGQESMTPPPTPVDPNLLEIELNELLQTEPSDPVELTPVEDKENQTALTNVKSDGAPIEETEKEDHFDLSELLKLLSDGSLVLVSTVDESGDENKNTHEIYKVNKATGVVGDEPLYIPTDILQCILSVMN